MRLPLTLTFWRHWHWLLTLNWWFWNHWHCHWHWLRSMILSKHWHCHWHWRQKNIDIVIDIERVLLPNHWHWTLKTSSYIGQLCLTVKSTRALNLVDNFFKHYQRLHAKPNSNDRKVWHVDKCNNCLTIYCSISVTLQRQTPSLFGFIN